MTTLALGLIAALCWGFHDICVRFLSQKTPITACIFVVLLTGLIFHAGLTVTTGNLMTVPLHAVWLSVCSGVCFVIATFGLYYAFQRGPVRLVAPLIASFPILSVSWAAFQGATIAPLQWLAVVAIIFGVGIVAALSDDNADHVPPQGRTIFYALCSAAGFAGTFAFGQAAADISHELPATLVTRIIAMILVAIIILVTRQSFLPNRAALPWLIAMGIADGIALACVLAAGALPDPQYAVVTSSMFGLLTILLAWMFLRERMTPAQWAGCVVAFCGVGYLAL
jgi:drug/metabolite transporter (DMT)-like permease